MNFRCDTSDALDEALIVRRPVTVLRAWLAMPMPRLVRGKTFGVIPYFYKGSWFEGIDFCRIQEN
jgi:hypothetical protein